MRCINLECCGKDKHILYKKVMDMKRKDERSAALVDEIYRVQAAITSARDALDECRNPLLLEATAYELKYLQAKQSYLFDMARQNECTGLKFFK